MAERIARWPARIRGPGAVPAVEPAGRMTVRAIPRGLVESMASAVPVVGSMDAEARGSGHAGCAGPNRVLI